MTVATSAPTRGILIEGEFLGVEQQRDRTVGDTTYPGRYIVKLLAGGRVHDIEFKDAAAAENLVPELGAAQRLDVLTIPVGYRASKGYVFWFGRAA